MFAVCVRHARDRRLLAEFMDTTGSVPNHPGKDALVSVFETPGNLVQFQHCGIYAGRRQVETDVCVPLSRGVD